VRDKAVSVGWSRCRGAFTLGEGCMMLSPKDGDVARPMCAPKHYGDAPYRVEDRLARNPALRPMGFRSCLSGYC